MMVLALALAALALATVLQHPQDTGMHMQETHPLLLGCRRWCDVALLGWHWWGGSGGRWWWGGRAAAAVVGVPWHSWGGSSAMLAQWHFGVGRGRGACYSVGKAAAGSQWPGGMTEVAGVKLCCWGSGGIVGA